MLGGFKNDNKMEIKNETVTLSLATYKEMEKEIETLRKQVKQKTIIKEVLPRIYGQVAMVVLFGLFMLMTLI